MLLWSNFLAYCFTCKLPQKDFFLKSKFAGLTSSASGYNLIRCVVLFWQFLPYGGILFYHDTHNAYLVFWTASMYGWSMLRYLTSLQLLPCGSILSHLRFSCSIFSKRNASLTLFSTMTQCYSLHRKGRKKKLVSYFQNNIQQ